MMDFKKVVDLIRNIRNGPWKFDNGNWEVEGPERESICTFDHLSTIEGDFISPYDREEEGRFIAASRMLVPALTQFATLAPKGCICHVAQHNGYMGVHHSKHCEAYSEAQHALAEVLKEI